MRSDSKKFTKHNFYELSFHKRFRLSYVHLCNILLQFYFSKNSMFQLLGVSVA